LLIPFVYFNDLQGVLFVFFPEKFPENLLEKVLLRSREKTTPHILGIFCWRLIFWTSNRKIPKTRVHGFRWFYTPQKLTKRKKGRRPFAAKTSSSPSGSGAKNLMVQKFCTTLDA